MRKINAILAVIIMIMFVAHTIASDLLLVGVRYENIRVQRSIAGILILLVIIHIVISLILTGNTIYALKKSGASYFRENKLFWARRISGLSVMLFLVFHMVIFLKFESLEPGKLALSILLVLSLAVHIISNIRPLMISLGVRGLKGKVSGIIFVMSVLLLAAAVCFIIFGLQWIG